MAIASASGQEMLQAFDGKVVRTEAAVLFQQTIPIILFTFVPRICSCRVDQVVQPPWGMGFMAR